jgi:hypothetical protein
VKITDSQHDQFILTSLDDNQVHADVTVAESLGANSRIIHGIHQIIFVINRLCINERAVIEFKFNFIKPISVNQNFEMSYNQVGDKIYFSVENSLTQFTSGYFLMGPQGRASTNWINEKKYQLKELGAPQDLSNSIEFDLKHIRELYPLIESAFSQELLRRLLYTSFHFGVVIRSENTVIISVQLKTGEALKNDDLHTSMKRNGQAQTLKMSFSGKTLIATGKKYNQYKLMGSSLRTNLNVGRYGGQKALIFGGTGALGSVISKILIRDQSQVNVTYRSLEKLNKVFDHKLENLIPWEFNLDSSGLPAIEDITHIYFLLTPRIFMSNKPEFSEIAYDEFHKCYVTKIEEIIDKYSKGPLKYVFSPSTIAINQPSIQLKEYIKAKQEMENKLLELTPLNPHLTITFPRLELFDSLQTSNIPEYAKKLPEEIAYRYLPFTS